MFASSSAFSGPPFFLVLAVAAVAAVGCAAQPIATPSSAASAVHTTQADCKPLVEKLKTEKVDGDEAPTNPAKFAATAYSLASYFDGIATTADSLDTKDAGLRSFGVDYAKFSRKRANELRAFAHATEVEVDMAKKIEGDIKSWSTPIEDIGTRCKGKQSDDCRSARRVLGVLPSDFGKQGHEATMRTFVATVKSSKIADPALKDDVDQIAAYMARMDEDVDAAQRAADARPRAGDDDGEALHARMKSICGWSPTEK